MSEKRIVRRVRARQDLVDHYLYLSRQNPQAAEQFLGEAEQRIISIADNPLACSLFDIEHPRLIGMRHCRVSTRFRNYVVFYRPIADGIELIRVLHAAQDLERVITAE